MAYEEIDSPQTNGTNVRRCDDLTAWAQESYGFSDPFSQDKATVKHLGLEDHSFEQI